MSFLDGYAILQHLADRSLRRDAAISEYSRFICPLLRQVRVVRADHKRGPLLVQPLE